MKSIAAPSVHDFRADDRGSILPTFAVMLMGITLASGVALDYGRLHHANSRMTTAADAAAIAAGKALLDGRNSDAEIKLIAKQFFDQNLKGTAFATVSSFEAEIDRATNKITIHLESSVPTTVMKIARIDQMSLPVTSIATFEQKDIELALALDVTGSMMGRKLRDLKSATKDLVDIMLPSEGTPNKVRVAFAPYAAGVNAGTYTEAAAGRAAANGCTFERQGANPEQDHAPGPGTYLGTGAGCPPSAKVIGLTDDARLLKSSVEDYAASGTTAGHLGAQWASYLVSPNWGGVLGAESRPAPYNDGKTVKAIVLMTDGEFNTWEGRCDVDRFGRSNCNPNGTRGQQSNDRAKEVCEAAKAKGVQVFTVGFELNHPVALATLAACASSANHAFRAENGDELREAFAAIGRYLTNLRIAQ